MNGLNGEQILTIKDLFVGTVDSESYGYKRRLRVTIDIRMEALTGRPEYQTIYHATVSRPLDFAITTSVWQGATVEPLRKLTTFAPGFSRDKAQRLANLGERWHLNDMRAGCAHQTVVYEDGPHGRQVSLSKTPACPETGYRYGSAWLIEELPSGFMEELKTLLPSRES